MTNRKACARPSARCGAVGGLCVVQFRDAGDREALRGHSCRNIRSDGSSEIRRRGGHQSMRTDRRRCAAAVVARRDQRGAHRLVSMFRTLAFRPMRRSRTCSQGPCYLCPRRGTEAGPVATPESGRGDRPTVTLLGGMFPADPATIGQMLAPLGLAAGPVVPCREWRELYTALDCDAAAAIHPFYTSSIRAFESAGARCRAARPWGSREPESG